MNNKLIQQILKFGVVGGISFIVDWLIGLIIVKAMVATMGGEIFETASLIGAALGFTISVIVNYILSMKFVFERKDDMDRKKEFTIFVVLSIIGLGLTELIIWICISPIYGNVKFLQKLLGYGTAYTLAKAIAAGLVMVYNFVTRKIFLEKK